jgi:hypothetical protein
MNVCRWPVAAAMAMLFFAILTQTTIINASHSLGQAKTETNANLPRCETGVNARYGVDCGPAICGFGK